MRMRAVLFVGWLFLARLGETACAVQVVKSLNEQVNLNSLPGPLADVLAPSQMLAEAKPASLSVMAGDMSQCEGNEGTALIQRPLNLLQTGQVVVVRYKSFGQNVLDGSLPQPEGSISGGLSTEKLFGPSWAMKGIAQRKQGNLSARGGARLNWGTHYKSEATIEWYIERSQKSATIDSLEIYSVVNGHPDGHAFSFGFEGDQRNEIAELKPSVAFDDEARNLAAAVTVFEPVPIPKEPAYRGGVEGRRNTYLGKWELDASSWDQHPWPEHTILTIMEKNGHVQISAKVSNTMSGTATFGHDGTVKMNGPGLISTMMMPAPVFQPAEKAMGEFLPALAQWQLQDGVLVLSDKTGQTHRFVNAAKASAVTEPNVFIGE